MPTLEELRERLRRGPVLDAPPPPVAPEEKHRWVYRHKTSIAATQLAFQDFHFIYAMERDAILGDNPWFSIRLYNNKDDCLEVWAEDGSDAAAMAAIMSDLEHWSNLGNDAKSSRAGHWRERLCSGRHRENHAAFMVLLDLLAHASMTYRKWKRDRDFSERFPTTGTADADS